MNNRLKIEVVESPNKMQFWKITNNNNYDEVIRLEEKPTQFELVQAYTKIVMEDIQQECIRKLSVTVNDETFTRLLLDGDIIWVFADTEFYGERSYYMIESTGSYINHFKKWDIDE